LAVGLFESEKRKQQIFRGAALLAVAIVTAVTFYGVTANDFLHWDDNIYVVDNPFIRDLSWQNIKTMFSVLPDPPVRTIYHPLMWFSYALDYKFFGLNPRAYHTTNYLIHIVNSILVFWLLMKITRSNIFISFIVSTLFGIHPLHVESVVWVSERKDVLYAFFYILSFIAFITYRRAEKKRYYLVSLVLFLLSLMSKPSAITLPFVLILWDFYERKKFEKSFFTDKIPYILAGLAFSLISINNRYFIFTKAPAGFVRGPISSLQSRALLAMSSVFFYIYKAVCPVKLSALYPYPQNISIFSLKFFLPIIGILLLLGLCAASLRYTKKIFFGFFLYLIVLAPFSGIIEWGRGFSYLDRATYISAVGLFFLFACGLYEFWKLQRFRRFARGACVVILIFVVGILSKLSFERIKVWKNDMTLWTSVIEYDSGVALAHYQLANAYYSAGDYQSALDRYRKSLALGLRKSEVEGACSGIERIYRRNGDLDGILLFYQELLEQYPDNYLFLMNIAAAYQELKNYEKALHYCEKAIRARPDKPDGYSCLADCYVSKGMIREAEENYRKAIERDKHFLPALINYSGLLFSRGEYRGAAGRLTEALEVQPEDVQARMMRAACYEGAGDYERAIEDLKRAIELEPKNADAHFQLALIYHELGLADLAVAQHKEALKLDERKELAYADLAKLYRENGKMSQAHETLLKALEKCGESAVLLTAQAHLFYDEKRYDEALDAARRALAIEGKSVGARILLAEIYVALNKKSQALAEFKKALVETTDPVVRKVIEERIGQLENEK